MTDQQPHIHLYAEHLQNIRTLSIQASLATHSSKDTTATLSADGSRLTLEHESETATIELPVRLPGRCNDNVLTLPAAPSKNISFRFSVLETPATNLLTRSVDDRAHVIPWTATDLTPETEIHCASCLAILSTRGAIKEWKDLPSEGWAEMMDLWHCHKPDVPHAHETNGDAGRGIGTNSRLAVEQGVGLVGPLDLLFARDDCPWSQVGLTIPFILLSAYLSPHNSYFILLS